MLHAQKGVEAAYILPASFTAGSNVTQNFDMTGYQYATVRVLVSDIATPTVASASGATVSLLYSDNTNSSTFTTAVADRTGIKNGREVLYHVNNAKGIRYIRLNLTAGSAGVSNDTVRFAAIMTGHRATEAPSSLASVVAGGTNDTAISVVL